jgi:hypothetical protein
MPCVQQKRSPGHKKVLRSSWNKAVLSNSSFEEARLIIDAMMA